LKVAAGTPRFPPQQTAIWQKWWQRSAQLRQIPTLARSRDFANRVLARETDLCAVTPDALGHQVRQLRAALAYHGVTDALAVDAFALVREVAARRLGLSAHATQIVAARIMLDNQLVEMAPGEGKSLAILIAAATVALSGMPVHVILATDHLTLRDVGQLATVYEALGLTVGTVVQTSSIEDRRFEYSSDVTYCSAREVTLDYLRDCLLLNTDQLEPDSPAAQSRSRAQTASRLLLRGLGMAILDDADRTLMEDARTPSVLSQRKTDRSRFGYYWQARLIADGCRNNEDFVMDAEKRALSLTGSGMLRLETLAKKLGGMWNRPEQRERLVTLALVAKYLFHRDFDYVVRNARVMAIDPDSGRVCGPSIWPRGLQQLIELKEGCEITGDQYVGVQTSYPAFLSRFPRLAGIGSALREARDFLHDAYGLKVMQIPRRVPSHLVRLPLRVYASRTAHSLAVAALVHDLHASNVAVLIRTGSIAESEHLSLWFKSGRLPHSVLNGHDAAKDARKLSRAGMPGHITIVSQSAGRGTDIQLADGVAQRGGLHFISCSASSEPRIDRFGEGWSGRRGDPGTSETLLCLQLGPLQGAVPPWMVSALQLVFRNRPLPAWFGRMLLRRARRLAARHYQSLRVQQIFPDIPTDAPFIVTPPRRTG
jgi:preprotein translocase subunit SecA